MARSTDSSSQDEQTAYKEKDAYGRQDVDQMPTVDNDLKSDGPVITAKSKGVVGMELLLSRMNVKYLILLYGGFILLSYTLSLGESGLNIVTLPQCSNAEGAYRTSADQYTSGTYTTYATSGFEVHSLLSTIGVIRAIFQSISQPPMAKIADVFGRVNAYVLSVVLYVLGMLSCNVR